MGQQRYISTEGRRRLREAAQRNRPWEHATGPRTPQGKARSSQNARKHGCWRFMRESASYRQGLRDWLDQLDVEEARQEVRDAIQQARNLYY